MNEVRRTTGNPDRVGVILPGSSYTADRPLLHFARAVLVARGWTVLELWWDPPRSGFAEWVRGQAEAVLRDVAATTVLLVGKSLGTLALPLAARRNLPGIWLTPLLTRSDDQRRAVAELAAREVPTMLVGGTEDGTWDRALVPDGVQAVELVGADHDLELRGDAIGSVGILAAIIETMGEFVARVESSGP